MPYLFSFSISLINFENHRTKCQRQSTTAINFLITPLFFQNPVPLLNKTVKQYLGSSEGKLLFSLVREFLEYFGLDYTMSVYDPETYFGKEYKYAGRNKLCEELGISSSEPLLGEILKNTINGAFNNVQKVLDHCTKSQLRLIIAQLFSD